jgi:multiple sugar transport system ATP-binding protein
MATIRCEQVSKQFSDGTRAVDRLDLEIADGELMVLVGPSGCGKTTLLRMIAGLEPITEGHVLIDERVVNDVPAKDRDIGMVFQNYALYPHMTVHDNIGFALKLHRVKKVEITSRVQATANTIGLGRLLTRKPRQLSGGQRQRVAMGRAMARQPQVFLMDEPLSNLDAKLRVQMRAEIGRTQRLLGVTAIYVTHDQVEAMTLGDRVAVMRQGVLQQVAAPKVLYERPANLFVAGFIGSPAMNLVEGTVRSDGQNYRLEFAGLSMPLAGGTTTWPGLEQYVDGQVVTGIRPESLEDAAYSNIAADSAVLEPTVELREDMGHEAFIYFTLDAQPVLTEDIRELAADTDAAALQELDELARERRTRFVARVTPRSRAAEGGVIRLAVDTSALYLFDPSTGEAIARTRERTPSAAAAAPSGGSG